MHLVTSLVSLVYVAIALACLVSYILNLITYLLSFLCYSTSLCLAPKIKRGLTFVQLFLCSLGFPPLHLETCPRKGSWYSLQDVHCKEPEYLTTCIWGIQKEGLCLPY